ncbi:MAG: hypothetical protein ACREJC_08650, partial [Tepidisphaeraceae bacterium]
DLFSAGSVATLWGISAAAGSTGGALLQLGVGRLVDLHSSAPVFAIVSVMGIAQALLVSFFIPQIRPIVFASQ